MPKQRPETHCILNQKHPVMVIGTFKIVQKILTLTLTLTVTKTRRYRRTTENNSTQLLSIVDPQLVQYFGLYRTRSAHSRTICCSLCVFFSQKYRSYTGINNNIIHTVHALSATYRKDRLKGGGV